MELRLNRKPLGSYGNYKEPPIPKGWRQIRDGPYFVLLDPHENSFTWQPYGKLTPNGTLDGRNFDSKFGLRQFGEFFPGKMFRENVSARQLATIEKYGGMYISTFLISMDNGDNPCSVKDAWPLRNISFEEAKKEAQKFGDGNQVTSEIPSNLAYDSSLELGIENGEIFMEDLIVDASKIGNFYLEENGHVIRNEITKTGANESWKISGLYDLCGNLWQWSPAESNNFGGWCHCVARGGSYVCRGKTGDAVSYGLTTAHNGYDDPACNWSQTGFRACLCIE